MNLAALFFCGCLCSVGPPAAAAPQRVTPGDPQTDSPVQVSAAAGADGLLPCHCPSLTGSARVMAVEWTRVDGPSAVTIHVVRNGEELVKEKAAVYAGRTVLLEDGSLKLLGVRLQDSGTYKCVQVRGPSREDVLVSLSVAQVPPVSLSVRRSSDNQLLVLCESSGWSLAPVVSLLDSSGGVLAAQTESSVRPDGLFAVSALVDVAVAGGNGPLICRVGIPELSLANQEQLLVTDNFHQERLSGRLVVTFVVVAFVVICGTAVAVVVSIVPLWMIENLRFMMQRLTDQPFPEEYGNLLKMETSGASEVGARTNGVDATGVDASYMLAERDLKKMNTYKGMIICVGNSLCIPPALIAAIISRQSRAGTILTPEGYGKFDSNCFGLMQINKHYHHVLKRGAFSREHVEQGVTFLIQLFKTMKRAKPDWGKEQQLKGALACYISGEDRVLPLTYDMLDSVTPLGDFANDVVARAHWFLKHGFVSSRPNRLGRL